MPVIADAPDPTAERRDEVVKRMLATPPQKHAPKGKSLSESEEYQQQRSSALAAQAQTQTKP